MKLLTFAASLGSTSINRKLLEVANASLRSQGATVTTVPFSELDVPSYCADVDGETKPPGTERWKHELEACDGMVIASPEYNFSIPGHLKNAIDWVSRYRPTPLSGVPTLLLSASPGLIGGNRGLWALRVPLESLGVPVYPKMFSLSQATKMLGDGTTLTEPNLQQHLESTLAEFITYTRKLRG